MLSTSTNLIHAERVTSFIKYKEINKQMPYFLAKRESRQKIKSNHGLGVYGKWMKSIPRESPEDNYNNTLVRPSTRNILFHPLVGHSWPDSTHNPNRKKNHSATMLLICEAECIFGAIMFTITMPSL